MRLFLLNETAKTDVEKESKKTAAAAPSRKKDKDGGTNKMLS